MDRISWCLIRSYSTRRDALVDLFSLSGQWLKKYSVGKDWLEKPCKERDELTLPIEVINKGMIAPEYKGESPIIICEDENFLCVHKPIKVHTHPHSYTDEINTLSFLRSQNKFSYLNINQANYDRGLLYRLDFETSGLLILTSKEDIYLNIRQNFSQIFKNKWYIAVVVGEIQESGHLSHFFTKSSKNGEKMKVANQPFHSDSQMGELSFNRLSYNQEKNISLVAVNLKTGIRHQIRAQLAHIGFPLLGDPLYGDKTEDELFLHCYFYGFNFNQKEYKFFDSNLGRFNRFFDLDSCLKMLSNQLR